jgi:hypothetical protein
VIVDLSDGRAVAGKIFAADVIGFDDRVVDFARVGFEPREESGAEVETDTGIVIDYIADSLVGVEYSRGGVRGVALGCYALVPVMVGMSRVLNLDLFEPCVFPRRLVKMPVNADVAIHKRALFSIYLKGDPITLFCCGRPRFHSVSTRHTSRLSSTKSPRVRRRSVV